MKALNLLNQKFHKLLVVEKVKNKSNKTMWRCLCDCGNEILVSTSNLRCNRVKSCGCLKIEKLINRSTTHNQRHTNLYEVWKSMKQRCFNPQNASYKNYGARGITVCNEWKNSFTSFYEWSILNGYNEGLTIDRINNNSSYCPKNCRWVDRKIQANNSRWNKHIIINGKDDTQANWLRFYNIPYYKYYKLIKSGLSESEAIIQLSSTF